MNPPNDPTIPARNPTGPSGPPNRPNRYGLQAWEHWRRWLPRQLAAVADPATYFTALGEQAAEAIDQLAAQIAGNPPQQESDLARLGRLREARISAESEIVRQMILVDPEDEDEDPTDPDPWFYVEHSFIPAVEYPTDRRWQEDELRRNDDPATPPATPENGPASSS